MINIILGPPGTGKTTKLLEICQQKKEQGITWDKIGFFSFSRKAAHEARDRARHKFQASKDDLVHFRTLHSYAFRHLPVSEDNLMKQKHWKELSEMIGFNLVFNEFNSLRVISSISHFLLTKLFIIFSSCFSVPPAFNDPIIILIFFLFFKLIY